MDEDNLNVFQEQIYYLCNRNIISPGAYRNYGDHLPYFHVTKYGKECFASREILPYDEDGYIAAVKSFVRHNEWDVYYFTQIVECFKNGLYDAASMFLGIENEYIADRLIENYEKFVAKNEVAEATLFKQVLAGERTISKRYEKYMDSLKKVAKIKDANGTGVKYPNLIQLKSKLDDPAQGSFMTCLRLTQNEMMHPANRRMDASETMMLIISALHLFGLQMKFLDFYITNS